MNQRQKEVLKSQLRDEKKIINDLKKIYKEALTDINQKVAVLMVDESMQSKIYQVGYQNRLKKQIEASLELLNSGQYEKIHNYLQDCYSSGFVGAMYDLHGQGIPLIMPIDQKAMVKAVQTDLKISKGLYTKLGKDVGDLKKRITSEVSRGVAQALPYKDVTRNLNNVARIGFNRSMRIARTEGHRITQASALDGMRTAKSAGADVLKQWDATLDGHTRDHHRELDGQIRDVDDDFEVGGMTVEAPGMFGDPAEDCNCRCCLLQRARWELDESELDTLRERADYFGLDKEKDFDDFKIKYLNSVEKIGKRGTILPMNLQLFAEKTQHASERMQLRDIKDAEIDDALKNPLFKGNVVIDANGRKSIKYIGKDATVVLNPETNKVITSWKTSSRLKKKYERDD
jgi:hypothetical protein|nr:MAG TPA: minor capsid protein [Caudoviricetes sp.]